MTKPDLTAVDPAAARRRARLVAGLLALAVLGAACSADDSATPSSSSASAGSSTSTSSTTSSSPTSTRDSSDPSSPQDEIIDRYVGFWDARAEANTATPNPDDPALSEFATGEQLERVIDETRQRRDDGLALRAAEPSRTDHTVTVVSVGADRAELQDCFVNDGVVYRVATGEVVDDSVVTRNVSAVMVLADGVWKLEQATVIQEWEGVAGCALAG